MSDKPFDYLESFQMHIMLYVIIVMGYIFSWLKFFVLDDCYQILRLIRLVCFSSMMFREIALSDPSYFTWKPFFISLLTFTSIRVISLIASLIFSRKELFLKYLQLSFSYSYINFFSFGYPFIHLFYGEKYEYICVIANIAQSFIMRPIDSIMVNTFSPSSSSNAYSSFHLSNQSETQLENLDHPEQKISTDESISKNDIQEHLMADSDISNSSTDSFINHDEESPKKALLYAAVSPQNVCTLLGIAYSFTKWKLPAIIDTPILNFANMIIGVTLFFIGVALWSHPWKGCNYIQVIPCLIMKHIIIPLIALLFCWLLKCDSLTARCCVILFSMPSDYTGIALLSKSNLTPNSITFSFFFSQILGLPFFFAWIAVFNETKLFSS